MRFFLFLWWKTYLMFLNPPPYLVGLPCTHTQRWAFLGSVGGKVHPRLLPGGTWAPPRLSIWFQDESCLVRAPCCFSCNLHNNPVGFVLLLSPFYRRQEIQGGEMTCPKLLNQQARPPNHFSLIRAWFLPLALSTHPRLQGIGGLGFSWLLVQS